MNWLTSHWQNFWESAYRFVRQHASPEMTLKLITSDNFEVDCTFDEGNRLIVIDREDYRSKDEYIALTDGDEEFKILSFEVVKVTRVKVLLTLEMDSEDDSYSPSSQESDSVEDSFAEDSEEDDSEDSEEVSTSASSDDYWEHYQ